MSVNLCKLVYEINLKLGTPKFINPPSGPWTTFAANEYAVLFSVQLSKK